MFGMVLGFFENRGDVNILDGIENLIAMSMVFHQPSIPQAAEMMRYGRGRGADEGGDLVDAPFALGERKNHFGAREVGERLKDPDDIQHVRIARQLEIARMQMLMSSLG